MQFATWLAQMGALMNTPQSDVTSEPAQAGFSLSEMKEAFFPFSVYGEGSNYRGCEDFYHLFIENKPKEKTWYCFDSIIIDHTTVKFEVFGIHDNLYGGKGRPLFNFTVKDVPFEIIKPILISRARHLAKNRYLLELELEKERAIEEIKLQFLKEIGVSL
jgi:hypothetical protein